MIGIVGIRDRSTRPGWKRVAAMALLAVIVLGAAPATADEYDPDEAGHPMRIAGYLLHPVGVTLDFLILRPAFWVGSHEPFRTLFGRTD
jgi:hypothetical protein